MRYLRNILNPRYNKFILIILLTGCSVEPEDLTVIPRKDWNACPAFFPEKLENTRTIPVLYKGIIIHYSGFSNSLSPKEIQVYHLTKLGFADINYHYLIDSHGFIYEGRNLKYKAEKFTDYENYIHICCISDMKFYHRRWLTKKQRAALRKAVIYICKNYEIENNYIKYFDSTGYEYVNFTK